MFRVIYFLVFAMISAMPIQADDLRVMSFNIRYGTARDGVNQWENRKDFVADTIVAFDPDVLATQETLAFQKDFLYQKLNGYTALGVGRDDGTNTGEMTAIFYKTDRFEKLDAGHFWLSETPDVPGSVSWDSSLTRMASWVRFKDRRSRSDRAILFINTHFDHRGKIARIKSAELISEKASKLGGGCDVILTGDFNAAVDSKPYQAIFKSSADDPAINDGTESLAFIDTYRAVAPKSHAGGTQPGEATFNGFRAGVMEGARIDWIAIAGQMRILSAGIDRTSRNGRPPSDHYPVTATIRQLSPESQP